MEASKKPIGPAPTPTGNVGGPQVLGAVAAEWVGLITYQDTESYRPVTRPGMILAGKLFFMPDSSFTNPAQNWVLEGLREKISAEAKKKAEAKKAEDK